MKLLLVFPFLFSIAQILQRFSHFTDYTPPHPTSLHCTLVHHTPFKSTALNFIGKTILQKMREKNCDKLRQKGCFYLIYKSQSYINQLRQLKYRCAGGSLKKNAHFPHDTDITIKWGNQFLDDFPILWTLDLGI